jgi:general secretion pathway protein A
MYQDFFGLRELPFELTPNPRFLFMTPRHKEALGNLQYGLSTAKAVTVLIGEAGTGKTTLLRSAFESDLCKHVQCVYLNNPALTRGEFFDVLARRFGLSPAAGASKSALLAELELRLVEAVEQGRPYALVIDEAQRLSDELLEEVRLLANIETPERKLLPLVLAGQPELAARLNQESLRQLKQRVSLRCEITRFELPETAAYIASRVQVAGGNAVKLFTREAVTLIHERSRGIPRTISVLCDNALLNGFAQGVRPVGRALVLETCRDFDFGQSDEGQLFTRIEPTPLEALSTESPEPAAVGVSALGHAAPVSALAQNAPASALAQTALVPRPAAPVAMTPAPSVAATVKSTGSRARELFGDFAKPRRFSLFWR